MDLEAAKDDDLAEQLAIGNGDALAILVDRYQRLVYSIAFRIVRDEGEAEDLVQVVFLEIFRKVKLFDPFKGTFKVWLLRYAYTRSMNRRDHLEHRKFYATVELDEANPRALLGTDWFDASLTEYEATRFVEQALAMLNANQRKAIDLIALEGLTLQEAARALGYSVAATRNYYYRGMVALRTFAACQSRSVEPCTQPLTGRNANFEVANLKARTA
jgi:RNA polymerase sigma-70 factor (ECF subfamily)